MTKVYEKQGFQPEDVVSVVDVMRHIERDKGNKEDPQTPTHGGEIAAFGMGVHMRRTYSPDYTEIRTSPQPRGRRHAELFVMGVRSYQENAPAIPILVDERLNDFSTDTRSEIKAGMTAAKELGKRFGTEVEAAIYQSLEGLEAVKTKVYEAEAVLRELAGKPGTHGMIGMHGACIEGLVTLCVRDIVPDTAIESAMAVVGGQFDKCEGARVSFDKNGKAIKVEVLRLPPHIKAMFAVLA